MNRKSSVRVFCCALVLLSTVAATYTQSNFIYLNIGSYVAGFSVGPNGVPMAMPGSPFATGGVGFSFGNYIAVSPLRDTLFASNDQGNTISAFAIDPNTGVLSLVPGSPFDSGTGLFGGLLIAITPDGQFLYAINKRSGVIGGFRISSNGGLTPLFDLPFGAAFVTDSKISPNGKFLFLSQGFSPAVAAYSIASSGSLTPVPGSPFRLQSDLDCDSASLDVNCDGTLLFASTNCGEVNVFGIASNGVLTQIAGSPFNSGQVGLNNLLLNSRANLLFVTNFNNKRVLVFGVSPTGAISSSPLSSFNIGDPRDEDSRPIGLAISRDESLLYVNTPTSTIFVFSIVPGGSLTPIQGSPFIGSGGYGTTITAYPPRLCGPVFDMCVQDDSSGNILNFNSTTGEYQLIICGGTITGGNGLLSRKGCLITLQHNAPDRRVLARIETCQHKATASVQLLSSGTTISIVDMNTLNNSCVCR
jgi:6-phosphogluconolactonase